MIVDFLLGFVVDIAAALVELLPAWSPPAAISDVRDDAVLAIGAAQSWLGLFLPGGLFGWFVGALLTLTLIVYAMRFIAWVWARVPVIGGGS